MMLQTDRYFYHSDHLGSSSFITDASGNATQHLQYLPFGETFIDQRTNSFSSRYTFSAKEKDDETGYSYFGARYYDSELSVWLSVDPMASKYPSVSGYNYCFNNPLNYRDLWGLEGDPIDKYNSKKEKFETSGSARHGRQLARYINRHSGDIGRSNAKYKKGSNSVTFDFNNSNNSSVSFREGQGPNNGNTNISGPDIKGGAVFGGRESIENYNYYSGNTGDIITWAGFSTSMYGGAADLAARDMNYIKYAFKGQNLLNQGAILSKAANGFSIAGGIIGVVDNGYQAYTDFSHGNYARGSVQATQAGAYGVGLGLIFFGGPAGVIVGGGVILGAGMTDMIEYFIETK